MTIDLMALAPRGRWEGSQLVDRDNGRDRATLTFGREVDDRGHVYIDTVTTEDGRRSRALVTHPKWVGQGCIKGWLPWARLPDNAVFEAQVGFVNGADGTDGVTFSAWAHRMEGGRRTWTKIARVEKTLTGRMVTLRGDLHHLSGQDVGIELRVDAGRSSGRDWAVWVNPRVVSSADPGSMPVTIELQRFSVLNADEDSWLSNGDEPYLLPVFLFADGSTIRLDSLARAQVRVRGANRTHGNLTGRHLDAGDSVEVPEATGFRQTSMKPIGGLGALGRRLAQAGVATIVMEEDATPTSAINTGYRVMKAAVQRELDNLVRSMRSPDAAAVDALIDSIKGEVQDAVKKEVLSSVGGIFSVVDPDDYIGAGYQLASYEAIQDAGREGIPFRWEVAQSGVKYHLTGRIRNY